MHRWVDCTIWTSLLVKCLKAFSLFVVCDLVHCKQLKHLKNSLAHNEREFNQMTFQMPLAKRASSSDNMLVVT